MRYSPCAALAARRNSTWPTWKRSNAPSTYTMRSSARGSRPSLNCTMRFDDGKNCAVLVYGDDLLAGAAMLSSELSRSMPATGGEPAACCVKCCLVSSSMRPTRSVVDTPTVRGMVRKRPAALIAAYVSRPLASHTTSSPCTTKSTPSASTTAVDVTYGAPRTTSSAHLHASTARYRSSSRITGGPLCARMAASECTPTTR
mmetsp:Transcript_18545/g.45661  ORF Transcript_18545/g.45661 Transcript_18545/m.45661 type:complete len:201 (+) Transcript_18545:383-985(+)